jgi:hypothetical protein
VCLPSLSTLKVKLRFLARLQIPKKQKLSLMAVLSLSILVVLGAIIRIARILHIDRSTDISWDSYDIDIWTAVEINAGIFCVSAPAVKPLLRQIAPGLLSSMRTTDNFTSQSRKHSSGTAISRMTANHPGFELSSQSNLELPPRDANMGNKSWIDFETKASRESDGGASGDAESERAIVEHEVMEGEIRKTVRVIVKGAKKDQGL